MVLFALKRVPEPEVMDAAAEVKAYTSAAAQKHLETIYGTFLEHLQHLLPKRKRLRVLDVGCGPGQIPIRMANRWPEMRVTGIDAAPHMIEEARRSAANARVQVDFDVLRIAANGNSELPYPDESFDVITCNSVVHHLADPVGAFNEIARVVHPNGAVLIRDLRRPSSILFPLHVEWFGRYYAGEMRRLYEASVRAAYTIDELDAMCTASRLNDSRSRVFKHGRTHIGIERPALDRFDGNL